MTLLIQSVVSAIEFMDSMCMKLVEKHLHLSNPIHSAPFYMLIEVSGSEERHNREKLNKFLEVVMEEEHVSDGTVATDMSKVNSLWALRERIAEALNSEGTVYKVNPREILSTVMCVTGLAFLCVNNMQYDLSLPVDKLYCLVEEVDARCKDQALCTVGYGHLGDGNLHLNVVGEAHSKELLQLIEPFVYDWTGENECTLDYSVIRFCITMALCQCGHHKQAHPYIIHTGKNLVLLFR